MPTQEQVMQRIYELFSEGSGEPISAEAKDALRSRYFDWIVTKKDEAPGAPIDVWDDGDGKDLQKRFQEVGKKAKEKKKDKIGKTECEAAYTQVEQESECPYCPDPIGG
ncbi:MAG TPA: hypothetical protein VE685_10095 [Thermoanaerobaculia bacterium]|nr:hypothetical protein [Thermoanaerobaculia bacterium]